VVQVYVDQRRATVRRPPRELAGFARVPLEAGASARIEVVLDDQAFAFIDPASGAWTEGEGDFAVTVGASSRDLRATVVITREGSGTEP